MVEYRIYPDNIQQIGLRISFSNYVSSRNRWIQTNGILNYERLRSIAEENMPILLGTNSFIHDIEYQIRQHVINRAPNGTEFRLEDIIEDKPMVFMIHIENRNHNASKSKIIRKCSQIIMDMTILC